MPFNIIRLQQNGALKQPKSLSRIIQDIISACQIIHISRITRINPKALLKALQSQLKLLTNAISISKIIQAIRLIWRELNRIRIMQYSIVYFPPHVIAVA